MTSLQNDIDNINQLLEEETDLVTLLRTLDTRYPHAVTLSTSFSEEDQVLFHLIAESKSGIETFTLDTGRLFPETYSTWSRTLEKYKRPIKSYHPQENSLAQFIEVHGPNSFYESVDNRKQCCFIRKVEPLQRALAGKKIWITGIRASHSPDRSHMPMVEWDEQHQVIKVHPLLQWGTEELKSFIRSHDIPYNPLHDKGFVSIGCAPCTRAINPGEDFRAGRWWWENKENKECGLHVHAPVKTSN
ncbi:MAG: phosphoadenylyl-sulfate reductase [Saprospiraceae bacterium]